MTTSGVITTIDPIDKISPDAMGNAIGSVPSYIASIRQPSGKYPVKIVPLEPVQLRPGGGLPNPSSQEAEQNKAMGKSSVMTWVFIIFLIIVAIAYLMNRYNEASTIKASPEHVAAIVAEHLGTK